ncbi:MAG: DUF1684 domain-containing protein [Ferruginibacter sp.]
MKNILILLTSFLVLHGMEGIAQTTYESSLKTFQEKYVTDHEVVKGNDKANFRFYPINKHFLVKARFEKIPDSTSVTMKTSKAMEKSFKRYGYLHFKFKDSTYRLTLYQSLKEMPGYEDYLFLPFTDAGSGEASYAGGRYIDLRMGDIRNGKVLLDFNKAYNPYCAYATGYNCPIPPRENSLPFEICAGEMNFAEAHP